MGGVPSEEEGVGVGQETQLEHTLIYCFHQEHRVSGARLRTRQGWERGAVPWLVHSYMANLFT